MRRAERNIINVMGFHQGIGKRIGLRRVHPNKTDEIAGTF